VADLSRSVEDGPEREPRALCGCFALELGGAGEVPAPEVEGGHPAVAGTVERRREEIVHYERFPLTDALVEARHNPAKVLKRGAHGHRNGRVSLLRFPNLLRPD
jgi:hypothetical protein